MSIEIYLFFLFLRDPLFWYLFQTAWNCLSNYQNIAKVTFCDLLSDNVVKFDNIKHLTIYTQEKEKLHFSYHISHFMYYVGLTCLQDDSLMLSRSCIWEIALCSTCRKQSEYFDERDVARLLTCYIYNGTF